MDVIEAAVGADLVGPEVRSHEPAGCVRTQLGQYKNLEGAHVGSAGGT